MEQTAQVKVPDEGVEGWMMGHGKWTSRHWEIHSDLEGYRSLYSQGACCPAVKLSPEVDAHLEHAVEKRH